MYNYIFWFFYKYFEWKDGFQSKLVATPVVCLTALIHFGVVYTVVSKLTNFYLGPLPGTYGQRKLIFLPIILGIFFLVNLLYYKKKGPSIIQSYADQNFRQTKHIVRACCIFVLPFALLIILLS